jgi:GNAT superfamily N-acetyltransferase
MFLRPAEPPDALAVARVHVRSWQAAYRTLLPQDFLDQLRPEDWAARYTFNDPNPRAYQTILAVHDSAILGFVTTVASRDPDLPHHGELAALYVDPTHWSTGLGRTLVTAARSQLLTLGFNEALLWVLTGNTRADRFYRADNWLPDGQIKDATIHNIQLNEQRYRTHLT